MNIKKLFLPIAAVAMCWPATASALEIEDFVLSQVRPRGIAASQPAKDGRYYYQFAGGNTIINRVSYAKATDVKPFFETSRVTFPEGKKVDRWDGYRMSADESKILLWADSEPIYRYSFSANYYLYDLKSGSIAPLSEAGGEEIATLSPTGSMVAFVKDNNVMVHDCATGQNITVTTDGKKNSIINAVPDWVYQEEFGLLNSFTWSADGRYLAFIRWDESNVPMCSMALYQGECRPNADYAIHPGSYDYKYPAAGEQNSVVSVMCYDTRLAKLSKIELPLLESDYVPSIAFDNAASPSLMVCHLNRAQNHFRIYAVDPATGNSTQAYDEVSDMWIDNDVVTGVKYYDGFFVVMSNRDGRNHLYTYDYDGRLLKQVTRGDYDVTAFYGYDAQRKLFYVQTNDGALNRTVRCASAVTGEIKDLTPGEGTYSATFNSDFSYYIRRFSDVNTPDQYVIYTTAGKKVRDLQLNEKYAATYASTDSIPRRKFFTMENDGYTLNGYITLPTDFDPSKQYPCIMTQYSGPGSQQVLNKWKMEWEEYFASQGFVIACVDGRGTGGQGREFEKTIYLNLGKYETIDQVAAARYMAAQPYVDSSRIGIWGWSFGGFEVLMAMSQPQSPYACGVSIAPVTSWRFYDSIYTERYMLTPAENESGYSYAPLDLAKDLSGDLLLIFGSADDNVRIVNSMQYIAKLHGQHSMFDMMIYTNMNHSINGCDVRLPLYTRVLNFFKEKLNP